jgi:UDP-N-acetylglucosamine--N-acetylmuramyl-(pentapeptide) pyrophosphoryl-undecaprenol N-acetylglucosamine transferase
MDVISLKGCFNLKKIILTGGGSAGHVTPNVALIPGLKKAGYEIQYIGTQKGIERKIIEHEKIKYHSISSGKLRRYFDIKNFSDPFKVLKGILDAVIIMRKEKPDVVFSKGGFVSVPVVIAAYLNKVPVVSHESDITPGLANKITAPYCTKVCVTFPESIKNIKGGKAVLTGTPIRQELLSGSKIKGLKFCGFENNKPMLLVIGGSLGSQVINENVRDCLAVLLKTFNIAHICGKGNMNSEFEGLKGYKQFEYIQDELPDVMNGADIVISRAGANVMFELLSLKKPALLIPLSKKSSRGDQILNAGSFTKSGYSAVLFEEDLNKENLINKIEELYKDKSKYVKNMENSPCKNGTLPIINIIENCTKNNFCKN